MTGTCKHEWKFDRRAVVVGWAGESWACVCRLCNKKEYVPYGECNFNENEILSPTREVILMFQRQPLFSSQKQNWTTPEKFYQELNKEFSFDFDPCPIDPHFDGLSIDWKRSNFVNPPYNQIKQWLAKGLDEWKKGNTVVFLIPSRTDTQWWHEYVMQANEIRFVKGRLKFGDSKNSAPFPSAIIIYRGQAIPPSTKVQGILA